jgi:hypothetical protein
LATHPYPSMIWIGGSLAVNVESFGDAFRKSAKELYDTKLEDANPDDLLSSGIKCQKYSILGDHLVKTYAEVFGAIRRIGRLAPKHVFPKHPYREHPWLGLNDGEELSH